MGREHAENLRNIPGARVVAVSDPDENSIAQARSAIGEDLLCFSNHQELLESNQIDAIIIATPNFTHVDILKV